MIAEQLEYPAVVSRAEWLAARVRLLEKEKELTRARDRLSQERRELPMVRVDQDYVFEGPEGRVKFAELFAGRAQLIVYHFMWCWEKGQPLEEPCRGCSSWADHIARGHLNQLRSRNTSLVLVSRAPYAKIAPFKKRMGWTIPWYSSAGTSFNFDFDVTIDAKVKPIVYNYRTPAEHAAAGTGYYMQDDQPYDLPGMSCFLRKDGEIFHTYSTYGRGGETTGGGYYLLDLTALGRQEQWEEPKGRVAGGGNLPQPHLVPYPDQYDV